MPYASGHVLTPKEILELPVARWLCRIVNLTDDGPVAVNGFIPEVRASDKRARFARLVEKGEGTVRVVSVELIGIALSIDIPGQVEGKIVVCTDLAADNSALIMICNR